ncbi:MAG: Ig-like domain-containing protein [Lachnospiraceae bacterium]|nr:Ig-like domain-containing protein [Lachnospiraceae bacterium]
MKSFFNRHEEEIEELLEEEDDLDIIDLDDTAEWSRLDIAEELAKQQAENLMEEIGDELAIIDVVEDDVVIKKPEHNDEDIEYLSSDDEDMEYIVEADEEDDIEYMSADEEDGIEYMSEEEDDEEEYDDASPFAFFENIGEWFRRWTVLDKVVAATGVLVLVVAIFTAVVYAGNRGLNKQIEAFAPIGQQLETVGVVGSDKLLAVADAKKAMLEAMQLEAELNQEYQENELSTEVKVIMKMTSVQKDLKIKFVNKKSGKLVGNIPFEVEIKDSENKTYSKIDEDKDGIIYLTNIVPGNYQVSMVELDELQGYSFSTSVEKIKVKENIAYEKIDVSEEIKNQNEVDVSKEDTAKKTETEAVLADTVEWVESSKKESNSQESYTKVDKATIAEPSLSASLNFNVGILRIMQQSMLGIDKIATIDGEGSDETSSTNPEEAAKPKVTAVSLNQSSASLNIQDTLTLEATVTAEEGADKTVTWSSSAPEVAKVENGTVTALADGTATITAKAGGVSATCIVTVNKATVSVTSVSLNKSELILTEEATEKLTATVAPENASDASVSWSSSDEKVATVDGEGNVKALKEGTATITAVTKDGNCKATCAVTVKAKVAQTTITLDKTSVTLKTGETLTLKATVTPSGKTVSWTSSNETKATVDSSGKVTAIADGEVTITATVDSKTATCKITISKAYDPKKDTTKALKDKSGNQMYKLENGKYVEAKVADYYNDSITFYKKEKVSQYIYTGWQNLDGKTYYFDKNGNKVTGEQVIQGAKYNFNSDGTLNTGSGILGIDVSTWNGNIDWNKVKNSGVSYVIIRTGFRGSTQGSLVEDNRFRQNIQGATNAGLKVGVYFFSQAVNEVEAVEEASMVLGQVKGYKLTYPVFIDVEPSGGRADKLSSGERTKVINAFCQTIQNGGLRAGIYANKTWLSQKMNVSALSGYKIWLAQYNSKVTYSGRYDMWQYSDKGTIPGIPEKVDMNLSYLSY